MEIDATCNPGGLAPPASAHTLAHEDRLFRRLALHILPILMFAYVTSYIDRVNVSFAKLQMSQHLGFSDAVFGFGAGIFFLGYVIFEVPSNLLLVRVGPRRWITRIVVSWGIVSGLTAFVSTPMQFYVMRFLLGVAEAGFIPAIVLYMTQSFPRQRRARILSMFYAALALAGLIGSPLTGFILQYFDGAMQIPGWKWIFILESLPAFVAALYVWKGLDDDVTRSERFSPPDRAILARVLADDRATTEAASHQGLFTSWLVWAFCVIYFLDVFAIYGYTFWAPTMIKQMGIGSDFVIGLLAALPNAVAVVVMVLFGRSADRRGGRRLHVAALLLMGAAGLGLSVIWHDQLWLGMFALCIANAGLISFPPLFWSMPTTALGAASVSMGIAVISSFGNLGGFFGPYAVGYLKQVSGSLAAPLFVMVGCLLLGLVLTMLLPARLVDR
ncbi:MFS transporter [Burkholderia sp. Nafp2/4-1b]|uniref:MFS transporter n=1 Tax=Burkholderia sp. Nafp2/4-1b TaxID=2116686 RepID=UPI000EF90525|nr:MFS transporter [Burkholderia sp. Nafp2/4-1b]RKT99375.1 MFS transporter [Burkholderia sp. Nafp2/4-1b]